MLLAMLDNRIAIATFQCPHGLELLPSWACMVFTWLRFNALMGLSCYWIWYCAICQVWGVSMPSWAWVVTYLLLSKYGFDKVSMPSWAWVVTARMSNILNFSWYFLCIPAIYRCILAYLPIFFNQLSKFLRCESPSTFLGTCLSHHSFIIFLVTNTNTLLSGLYLISTFRERIYIKGIFVSMPSRAYTSFLLLPRLLARI